MELIIYKDKFHVKMQSWTKIVDTIGEAIAVIIDNQEQI